MRIHSVLILGTALLLAGCSQASNTSPTAVDSDTIEVVNVGTIKTKAVLVYAEWCGSCKVLDPKLKSVRKAGPIENLEYITLDYTDKNKEAFFASAKAAGVESPLRELFGDSIKTGQLILIDADDQRVIEKVTKTYSEDEIVSALKKAVAAS